MSLNSDSIKLYVSGKLYSGWKSATITRSMEAASGHFSLSIVDYNPSIAKEYTLKEGEKCRLMLGNDTIITGYIDDLDISIDADSYGVTVSGRDRTADLIDCSAVGKPEYRNKSLLSIARELCSPFSIPVLTSDGQDSEISVRLNPKAAKSIVQKARRRKEKSASFAGENIATFRTQPGETVLECLERIAREKGILITSTSNGELMFTRSGKVSSGAEIVEGKNLLNASSKTSLKERFSDYIVNGMQPGAEGMSGNRWKAFKSTSADSAVTRYRPLVIMAENAMGKAGAKRRASWEAINRAAKSVQISASVPGWRTDSGEVWQVNRLVKFRSPSLRIDRELLITEVSFSISDSGETTDLTLKRPDAFLLESDLVLPNNEPVKPAAPIKKVTKKQVTKKTPFKKSKPAPISKSRDLVLNTNKIDSGAVA